MGVDRRLGSSSLPRDPDQGMVLEMATDVGLIQEDGYAEIGQVAIWADARPHHEGGGVQRPRAQDHLVSLHGTVRCDDTFDPT